METTDGNKLALAVLGTLLGTMALGVFSSAIYAPNRAVKPGYPLPAGTEATAPAPKAAPEIPFPVELAKAEVAKGQADTKICQTCHSFDKGGPIRVGPPLWGVVGRQKGSFPGFNYSEGMKSKGGDWTYDDLNEFLTKPSAYVAGHEDDLWGRSGREQARGHRRLPPHAVGQSSSAPDAGGGAVAHASADSCEDAHAGADSCGDADPCADSCGNPNAGADSCGGANAGADSCGDAHAGADSCGDAHAGADSCGDAHAGADSCGDAHAGADSCGDAHAGADSCGDAHAGADSCGDAHAGADSCGDPNAGADSCDDAHAGADSCDDAHAGADGVRVAVTVGNADAGEIRRAQTPHGPRARGPSRFA